MARCTDAPVTLRLHALQQELAATAHGAKAAPVARAAADLGVSPQTVHRWLQQHLQPRQCGALPARKRRVDAGERAIDEDELEAIAAALLASFRRSGQRILSFDNAVAMLRANGLLRSDLSAGRIATVLAERGLHPSQLTRPDPSVEQRSLHPNHVWQVDASVCVAYYLSNAQGLQVMDEKKFYRNKPQNLTRIQDERLIRYALADHYEHEVLTRYYLGSECAAHLADFLIWCMAPKPGHPMHGVPWIVQMDMGSANTSAPVRNMLARLQVQLIIHERHNSRANGSVEKAHHLVETHFESALKFTRVRDLEHLNAEALLWANHFGATALHSRYHRTRHEVWMRITADQKRDAPPVPLMRALATTHPESRTVTNDLTVNYRSRDYDLRFVPGVMAGSKVQVVINGLEPSAIEVQYTDRETGEQQWLTVQPTARDEVGRRLDAPVIGEQVRQGARGIVDRNRDAALQRAFGGATVDEAERAQERGELAFGGRVDPWKAARETVLPAFLPRRGTPLEAPALRNVQASRISAVTAAKRLREALGRIGQAGAYGPQVYAWLQERYGEAGVPEDQLDALVAQFAAPAAVAADAAQRGAPLRAVGGA